MSACVAIKIRLYCNLTRPGEIVKVTGSGPELGYWNPANSLTLHTSKEEWPIWRAGIFIEANRQPKPEILEYKYIIVNRSGQNYSEDATENQPKQIQQPHWENFKGNRTISLQTHGEVLIQDVFNEKKIRKLEVHTNEMSDPFGKNSQRQQLGVQSQDMVGGVSPIFQVNKNGGNDLQQMIQSGLSPPEAGFETISQDHLIARPTAKQQVLERMLTQKIEKQQAKIFQDELKNYVDREQLMLQSLAFDKSMQIDYLASLGQLNTPKNQNQNVQAKIANIGNQNEQQSTSDIKFIQKMDQQEKPNTDFLINQEALNMMESEQRKYVKMVRVVRQSDEDQNNEIPQLRNNNSQPYFMGGDDDDEMEQKVPPNTIQDYIPMYQLTNEQSKMTSGINQTAQQPATQPGLDVAAPDNAANTNAFNFNQRPMSQPTGLQTQQPAGNPLTGISQGQVPPPNMGVFFNHTQTQGNAQGIGHQTQQQQQFGQLGGFNHPQEQTVQPFQILTLNQTPIISQQQDQQQKDTSSQMEFKIKDNQISSEQSFFQPEQQRNSNNHKLKSIGSFNSVSQQSQVNNFDFSTEDEYEKKLLDTEIKITKHDSLVLMSYKLPVTVVKSKSGEFKIKESKSMLYPTIYKLREREFIDFQWIGWPGIIPETQEEKEQITLLLKDQKCYPIWLTRNEIEEFLLFHEQHLRTIFHGFKAATAEDIDESNTELWLNYLDVNRRFAQNLIQIKKERDMVWVHDTYLLMAPYYLRRFDINTNIGLSFHAPFPSSDIYRAFNYRSEILNSILHCDIIGFHLYDYARNFLYACKKIFQLSHQIMRGGLIGLEFNGRTILLSIQHIGINQEHVKDMLKSQSYNNFKEQVISNIQYKNVIISSVDRLHPISGILPKLQGYQHFLRQNATHNRNVCLIQYVSSVDFIDFFNLKQVEKSSSGNSITGPEPSVHKKVKDRKVRQIKQMIQNTQNEIEKLINDIHDEFGEGCLIYKVQNLTQEERLALWSFSHVLLNTSLRDGLSFSPFEFINTKSIQNKFQKSSIILSEFSGCARQLQGVHLVNPFDVEEISKNLSKVMFSNVEEKSQRMQQMFMYIQRHTSIKWCTKFLTDLKRAYDPMSVSSYQKTGFGADQRIIKFKQGFKEFEFNMIEGRYKMSSKRIIIIDQEGVIPMRQHEGQFEPTPDAIKALDQVSREPQNIVFVVSSESKKLMHQWYSKKAPKLGLAAENGFFWRFISENKGENDWNKLIEIDDFGWINQVRLLMVAYQNKTEGSFIEEKESSIIWNFRDTDFDFGQMQAKELRQQIKDVFQNFPIELVETKFTVQVVPLELKKEKLVKTLIEKESSQYGDSKYQQMQIDFILYIGDDGQAEQVFKYLNRIQTKQQRLLKKQLVMQNNPQTANILEKIKNATKMNISQDIIVYTCTHGRKATQAKYFLSDSYQIVTVLEQINEVQEKINNGAFKKENKSGKRHQSFANFSSNFKFKGLGEFNFNNDSVKTRAGGEFTRHVAKNKFNRPFQPKFGQMLNNKPFKQSSDEKGHNKNLQRTESSKGESASTTKKSLLTKKRGIADKIANKLGSDVDDSDQEFRSQDGKRGNFKVIGSDVNFGSDNENFD